MYFSIAGSCHFLQFEGSLPPRKGPTDPPFLPAACRTCGRPQNHVHDLCHPLHVPASCRPATAAAAAQAAAAVTRHCSATPATEQGQLRVLCHRALPPVRRVLGADSAAPAGPGGRAGRRRDCGLGAALPAAQRRLWRVRAARRAPALHAVGAAGRNFLGGGGGGQERRMRHSWCCSSRWSPLDVRHRCMQTGLPLAQATQRCQQLRCAGPTAPRRSRCVRPSAGAGAI